MTLTSKTMEWLNQNRRRSYPMVRDDWREVVSPESGLDCVLLDATAFNNDASGDEELKLVSVSVSQETTKVVMKYGETEFSATLEGGDVSGEGSYESIRGAVAGTGSRNATISLVFSSHAYILDAIGEGKWELGCKILPSRVMGLSDGFGVDGIATNGSYGVDGHESASTVAGDVVLEDGYRTSPIVHRGRVLVRVGKKYGLDPCFYHGETTLADCASPMFFFCGQNAVNGGNVVISGGKGISVEQGRSYTVKTGPRAGRTIPCIEIVANSELLDIYKPTTA